MSRHKKKAVSINIIYEDNHLIAVNKPAGWLVQGDETGDKPLSEYVKEYIKKKYDKPGAVYLGIIHRLDRPVSGVVLFARTSKGLERMNKMFREREVKKTYLAITHERPDPYYGKLTHYLTKDRTRNVAKAFERPSNRNKDAKKSTLTYELVAEIDQHYLIKVNPETGRPHQIRVQLSTIGASIKGDVKYGFKKGNQDGSIHLHGHSLEFMHPVKKEPITIVAKPPKEQFWNLFNSVIKELRGW